MFSVSSNSHFLQICFIINGNLAGLCISNDFILPMEFYIVSGIKHSLFKMKEFILLFEACESHKCVAGLKPQVS